MESNLNGDSRAVGLDIELSCGVNIAETIGNFCLESQRNLMVLVLNSHVYVALFEPNHQLLQNEHHLVH
jgi:hypothetical protein